MANKEEKAQPAYIDYTGQDHTNSEDSWTHTQFKEYWLALLAEKCKVYGEWNLKEQTLLSRLLKQYPKIDVREMMDQWINTRGQHAPMFGLFYTQRHKIAEEIHGKDYSDWD